MARFYEYSHPIIYAVPYCKVNCVTSFHLSQETTERKICPCSQKRSVFSFFFSPPSYRACQHPMIVMRLESVHATASLGQAGREGKRITISTLCVLSRPGADFRAATTSVRLELSQLLRSCLCNPCNTSTATACSDEQPQTYIHMHSHKDSQNHMHACTDSYMHTNIQSPPRRYGWRCHRSGMKSQPLCF